MKIWNKYKKNNSDKRSRLTYKKIIKKLPLLINL